MARLILQQYNATENVQQRKSNALQTVERKDMLSTNLRQCGV